MLFVKVEIHEGGFLLIADCFFKHADVIVDAFVGMLPCIEMHYIACQYFSLVAAAEGCNLGDKVVRFLFRYEARRLDSVYKYLQLGEAEAAILDIVGVLLAVFDLHDLIALRI